MRTTVDLPPAAHRRVRELAATRGQSMSAVIADLTMHGLSRLDVEVVYSRDPRSGLPVISLGRTVTDDDVAAALDDE
jgi:predicted transcriptional regulator